MTDLDTLAMILSGGRKPAAKVRKPAARAPFRSGQTVTDAAGKTYVVARCTSKVVTFADRPDYTMPVWFFKETSQ